MIRFLKARIYRSISKERPPAQAAVRVYERQIDFSRGVRSMQRQGWVLTTFNQAQPPDRLDMIRASAPGMLPHEARQQIVAHFACAGVQTNVQHPVHQPRRQLARLLVQVAQRLDCSVESEGADSTCANPA